MLNPKPIPGLDPEAQEQVQLVQWALRNRQDIPALALLFHIPNGGHRHPTQGALMKLLGVKRGIPDLFLPVPSGLLHGLWIEMKAPKGGSLSEDQKRVHEAFLAHGYAVEVCKTFVAAKTKILAYLGESDPTAALDPTAGTQAAWADVATKRRRQGDRHVA